MSKVTCTNFNFLFQTNPHTTSCLKKIKNYVHGTITISAHCDAHNVKDLKQMWLHWHQGSKKRIC
jgi:hypothetical protein